MKKLFPAGIVCAIVVIIAAFLCFANPSKSIDSTYTCSVPSFGAVDTFTLKGKFTFYGDRDGSNVSFVGQCTTVYGIADFPSDHPLVGTLRISDSLPETAIACHSSFYPDLLTAFNTTEDFAITFSSDCSQVTLGDQFIYCRNKRLSET